MSPTRLFVSTLLLAATVASARPADAAPGSLDMSQWLNRSGVRMVAVEFYATWCKPCMAAVPRWKALHEKYADRGLRLIVVATQDPSGQCVNPGWNPDDIVCDPDGRLARAMNVGNHLPAAFLWSWTGRLLVRRGHVDEVERVVRKELGRLPRAAIDTSELKGKAARTVGTLLRAELARTGKIDALAGKGERKALARARKASHAMRFKMGGRCTVGQELAPNSLIKPVLVQMGGGSKLVVQLFSLEKGCLEASGSARWSARRPGTAVAAAVGDLLQSLQVSTQMPGGKAPPPAARSADPPPVPERSAAATSKPAKRSPVVVDPDGKAALAGSDKPVGPSPKAPSTPVYKKWWFWTAIGVVVVGTIATVVLTSGAGTGSTAGGGGDASVGGATFNGGQDSTGGGAANGFGASPAAP